MQFNRSDKALIASYDEVSYHFEEFGNLVKKDFQSSRKLFQLASLEKRSPSPKHLEVVAVVAGLPFSRIFQDKLLAIQNQIQEILGETLAYWVQPENLALEFFVIKWPDQDMALETFDIGEDFLLNFDRNAFPVHFNGFQIHRDGCVVARGVDTTGVIRDSRRALQKHGTIPQRQSNWAHVPLGRILEPFPDDTYLRLIEIKKASQRDTFHTEIIDKINLVHELQWYMENRQIVANKDLLVA